MGFKENKQTEQQTKLEQWSLVKSSIQYHSHFLTFKRNLFIEEDNEFEEVFWHIIPSYSAVRINMACLNSCNSRNNYWGMILRRKDKDLILKLFFHSARVFNWNYIENTYIAAAW